MKAPRKIASVKASPKLQAELRLRDKLELAMSKVSFDQVWKDSSGAEVTTILLANEQTLDEELNPVMVVFYGQDGKYRSETRYKFVKDRAYVRDFIPDMSPAEKELGAWLSASLEDPGACKEFKTSVENWFAELPTPRDPVQP